MPEQDTAYRAKTYAALKGELGDSFTKTEDEYYKALDNEEGYSSKVYAALKGELGDSFTRTEEDFSNLIKKKDGGLDVSSDAPPEPPPKEDSIKPIVANPPTATHTEVTNPVTTLGEFLEMNQASANDLGFASMINPELPLTQEEVDKYTHIARNNKLAKLPPVEKDFDITPTLERTKRQIELEEMDNMDKKL